MFQQPSQGDRVVMEELDGALCLFYVHDIRQGIMTSYGEKEAVNCDVHVLDGPKAGESFINALIFQGALIGSLRSAAHGDPVLGRVGRGIAKPGQKPPFVLNEFTDADATLAQAWIAARPKFTGPTTPAPGATQAPPPATAPVSTAANGGSTTVDISTLPPEVQALLAQAGKPPF